jgi:hypothetical protein
MRPDEVERKLRQRLGELGPAPRTELLHVLMLADLEGAERIGEFWSYAQERIADRLRESERERLGRRPAEAKAFARRAKVLRGTEPSRRHARPRKA